MVLKGSATARVDARAGAEIDDKIDGSDIVLFHSTAHEVEDHQFTKTDPRSAFLLALFAGLGTLLALAVTHWLMARAIDASLIPAPPALQNYVN